VKTVFGHLPAVTVCEADEKKVRNGVPIFNPYQAEGEYALFTPDGTLLCVSGDILTDGVHILKMITSFY